MVIGPDSSEPKYPAGFSQERDWYRVTLMASRISAASASVPPTAALVRLGIRRWLAAMLVFLVVMLVGLAAAAIIASTATSFAQELPTYEKLLQDKIAEGVAWLQGKGADITLDQVDDILDPARLFPYIQQTLAALVEAHLLGGASL